MNTTALVALLGGAVVIAAAASSSESDGSSVSDSDNPVLASSRVLVEIFEFYTRKMDELTLEEINRLAELNARAKGVQFLPLYDYLKSHSADSNPHADWRQLYLLPPGVSTTEMPDAFSIWGSPSGHKPANPIVPKPVEEVCVYTRPVLTANGVPREECASWAWEDFFFRRRYLGQDNKIRGRSDLLVIVEGLKDGFADIWDAIGNDVLKSIASVASNYPGIGTVVAVGVTFLQQVGEGQSITNAALQSGKAAVPSSLRAAYDVGVGLAVTGSLDVEAALEIAMAAAIQQGYVTGNVLEQYNQIKQAYEDAKAAGAEIQTDLRHLGSVASVATL